MPGAARVVADVQRAKRARDLEDGLDVGHRLGEFAATRSFRGHGRAIAAAEAASATAAPTAGAPAGGGAPERSTNVRAGA